MKKANVASGILLNICSIAFGLGVFFDIMCQDPYIENLLSDHVFGGGTTEIINTAKPPIRYKTWYNSVEDVLNGNGDVAKAAESEGAVLLKNDNHALPLSADDKVSLFGVTAYDPMYSLDGAGEVKINKDRQQFLYDELEKNNVSLNKELADWYNDNLDTYGRNDYINIYDNTWNTNGKNATINGASWDKIPSQMRSATEYNTAIFVVGRMTNEAIDLLPNNVGGLGAKDDDYLRLTDNEISVLNGMKLLKEAGTLDKIVLLINQANPVMEDLPKVLADYKVDSCMWIGFPGSNGLEAVADLLVGKSSPSGGLSTTWFTSKDKHPSTAYYANSSNILMQEDIYLGYKYAETRYEDKILNQGNTSTFDYSSTISYPFGYGLSYADFDIKLTDIKFDNDPEKNYDANGELLDESERRKEGDDLIATVEVTNTSSTVTAKEIVQLYVQKPYSKTDKDHSVENASVELVGYGKTKKLAPNEKDVLEIKIDANKTFASYDSTLKNYSLEAGNYYISAARNSHEAINNILLAKGTSSEKLDSEYGQGEATNAKIYEVTKAYSDSYKYYTAGERDVTNLFDSIDPNIASGNKNAVTYMSRSDWTKTADNAKSQTVTPTGDMLTASKFQKGKDFTLENIKEYYNQAYSSFENEYPAYGLHRDENGDAEVKLSDMVGVEYDPKLGATEEDIAKWDYFLDQLTWDETTTLIGNGLRKTVAIDSIGKPFTNDVNASNGISWKFDTSLDGGDGESKLGFAYHFDAGDRRHNPTGYPCQGIIAATFNNDIAYAVGQAIGEDALWAGVSGLYGFGLGLHRNPYHGRAGEYYSDDSFLAGVIGGYSSLGAKSKGLYVYNKHFILNDQETSRTSYNTWLNEQTMREVYIRPFELAIEIGDSMNVMNSFNNVGSGWSGNNYNLMTLCLRGELGMRGFAVTDYWQSGGMNLTYGILAGTDLPDGNGAQSVIKEYGPDNGQFGFYAQACRQSARRILYTVANSNAMNFLGEGTIIINHDPTWYKTRDKVLLGIYIAFGISCTFFVSTNIYYFVKEAKLRRRIKRSKH